MAKSHAIFFFMAVAFSSGGEAAEPVVPGLRAEFDPIFAGKVLLSELNCAACHAGSVPTKGASDLSEATARIQRDYLEAFIADPRGTKPGTTMPDVLGNLSVGERNRIATALADYLSTQGKADFVIDPIDPKATDRGRGLFHKVGCAACHSPEEKTLPGSPPLHRLDDKYSLASLTAFLEDPLAVRPGGRMPDLQLSHWEAVDLASFLLRDQQLEAAAPRPPIHAAEGKALFEKHGCVQCHQPAAAKRDFAVNLASLDGSKSCKGASFDLSDLQQSQIAAALKNLDMPKDPEAEIQLTMARLNCIACHERDGFGGPAAERDAFFTTTNLNLGEQARIPPALTHIGAKLTPDALRKVLVGGQSVRPYMDTRMPKFGAANVEPLLKLFGEHDTLPVIEFTREKDEKVAREAGLELVGDKNLSCVACHTFNGKSATTLEGTEMTMMTERLQENWFHLYLRNPQQFHPTTIMPGFWPGGKSVRPEILDGDTGMQIDAIWQYLSRGREARQPSGIRREPIEYGPINGEAVMLRRQYNGIGKRGIGVGYPSGINLSFDAGQLRLGSIWKGDFGEMSGVWRGQGSGNVGERSRDVVRFPEGPAFARLESGSAGWPVIEKSEKAPGFQLKGYTLDQQQRPTFRYTFAGMAITDGFVDHTEGPSLIRTLTFDKPTVENLYFRAAADKELKTSSGTEGTFELPRGLHLKLSQEGIIRETGETKELLVPLAGQESIVIEYHFLSE